MAKFEGQDRRKESLDKVLKEYGFKSLDEAVKKIDPRKE